jgi:hypothetical protein
MAKRTSRSLIGLLIPIGLPGLSRHLGLSLLPILLRLPEPDLRT